jgi:hypothetical protein
LRILAKDEGGERGEEDQEPEEKVGVWIFEQHARCLVD